MILEVSNEENLIAQLFGNQPDSVVWFKPIFNDSSNKLVVDFEVRYCNSAASKILGEEQNKIIGTTLLDTKLMDKASISQIYDQCLKVWQSGEALEFTYYSPGFDKYFNVQRSKVNHGILSVTRDRTNDVKAEKMRESQSLLLQKVINNSPTCIVFCQAVRNSSGKIVDFDLLMVNDKIVRDLKLSKEEIESMSYCTLHPAVRNNGLLEVLISVIETGDRFNDEIYLEVFGGWFLLTADKVDDDKLIATYLDINKSKLASAELEEQANWYTKIVNNSSGAIVVAEAIRNRDNHIEDLRLKLANSAGRLMTPISEQDLGKRVSELFPAQFNAGHFSRHFKVIETGEPHSETLLFTKNGRNYWYQLSLSRLGDGVISNYTDISDIKAKELKIEEQANLLTLMLNSSLNGVYTLEAVRDNENAIIDFTITHVNEVFCKMSGRKMEDLMGRSFSATFPDTRASGIFERNCQVLRDGNQIKQTFHYKGDGVDRWYENSVNKVTENEIVIAFNDVTPLKQVTVDLEDTVKKLELSNQRLSDFTQIASHDLNAPLRKILMYIDLINERKGDSLDKELADYLDKIDKTANRMQALIDDLLTYSQIGSHQNPFEKVSLSEIVHDVQMDLESLIKDTNAKIVVSVLPSVLGDKTQLTQVFQNLLSNAMKFHKANDIPYIQIKHEGRRDQNGTTYDCISIKDNGIGFDEDHSDKIFQVFYRLQNTGHYEGTGIGLAIVQKAMQNHNGIIEVQSRIGEGSTFYLLFPNHQI